MRVCTNDDDLRIRSSMESRLHLLAQQLQRAHDPLVRNEAAAVQFGEDTAEAELLSKLRETIGDHLRRAKDGPALPRFVISHRLQPVGPLDPPRGVENAGAICRFFEPRPQIAVELHQALFGVGERLLDGVADVDRGAQIYFALAGMTGGLPSTAIDLQIG